MKKYNAVPNIDMRRVRAQNLMGSIMQEISPFLQDDQRRDVHEAIYTLLWRKGVEVLTDHERHALGLPDRGNEGWTQEELQILELKRQELLLNPNYSFLLKTDEQKIKGEQ